MSALRKRFRVSWEGHEPLEIRTSARDMVNVDPADGGPAMATFALLHAALVRLGHEPPPLEEWVDLLDTVEDLGTVVTDIEGPTNPAPSVGEPLPLRASPDATTAPSSTKPTTEPYSLPSLS
jgi:hypothetical protein